MNKSIQDLLDEEARLKNSGKDAEHVISIIRDMRGNDTPICFGLDDCSTDFLVRCPWRMDCGVIEGEKNESDDKQKF